MVWTSDPREGGEALAVKSFRSNHNGISYRKWRLRDVAGSGVSHLRCVLLRSWLCFGCRGKTSEAPLDQV